MKQLYILLILAFVVVRCTPPKEKPENEAKAIEEKSDPDDDWIVLFDGSNLDNWKGYLSDEIFSEWSIEEDGSMKFTPSPGGGKNIVSRDEYTNFILSIDWKISENGNSGVFWSVKEDSIYKEPYLTGPEIQVLHNEGHPDGKYPSHTAGALYDMIVPSTEAAKPPGEWNNFLIMVDHKANKATVDFNGTRVVEFEPHGETWDDMVANSKFSTMEGFGKYRTGRISLQDHNDVVYYRNIKIKSLD